MAWDLVSELTDTWRTSQNPAELLAMLAAPDEWLLWVWVDACRDRTKVNGPWHDWTKSIAEDWSRQNGWEDKVPHSLRCNLLRCLFPPPTATVECPRCKDGESQEFEFDPHKGLIVYADYEMHRQPCRECDGSGRIPAPPEPLPPWCYTSDVVDLARAAIGGIECTHFGVVTAKTSPDLSRLPLLADAIEEAGCTDTELIRHLREDECHLPECWALRKVLDGVPKHGE